ncbi:MAG: hypothetical protein HUK26_06125, partial [Duodenibacillus sp.]|nr:hypothetical protein [Duodenibacillus sp.]
AMIGEDFGEDAMGEDYVKAMRDCVVAGAGDTVEAMILKAADSLDIGRTAAFDLERFPFLKGTAGEIVSFEVKRLREELAREADLLQRMTDPFCQMRDGYARLEEAYMASDGESEEVAQALQSQYQAVQEGLEADYKALRAMGPEEFVAMIEGRVTGNPDILPLLSRYYRPAA